MSRVLILVEGPTERAVIERVLAPQFGAGGRFLHAKVLGKPGHKGGIRGFDAVRKEITALLHQERSSCVTTFFDYYGLPQTWPGLAAAAGKPAAEKAQVVEAAMLDDLRANFPEPDLLHRFIPYIQMHELEALLFANPEVLASAFSRPDLASAFAAIVRQCRECEEIDEQPATAPSRRIASLFPGYRKGAGLNAHAPIIAQRIGLSVIRQACPHFHAWLTRLEAL